MKVGDLVMIKDCEHGIIGCVIETRPCDIYAKASAKVVWADDLCDPSWVDLFDLEAINESR